MSDAELRANPYVGLRPFFADDNLYFYGREQQIAELLGILRQHRFLSVVGSSGSGKSSLVRAGLLPGLLGGFLVQDRDRWRTVQIKPGDAPIGNLAEGLLKAMEPAPTPDGAAALEHAIREGHTDAVVDFLTAHLGERDNLFLLVDQFEEIFAFRGDDDEAKLNDRDLARRKERARRRAEAADFVDMLLGLAERRELPIYVAMTMRTDFLGECDLFYGLPEALNRGRYLVPRLTREQLRDAVECPALLLGAEVAPRLLDHVLNELGDRGDRLPVLQHALLRTWDAWDHAGRVGPIDVADFRLAGGLEGALNQDAERALAVSDREATARVFKRLTDTDASQRQVRSPARISELMAASGADRATVERIVDEFRKDGRSFVHPSADGRPDDPRVDISHESLIRQWDSLKKWVEEERVSRDHYRDLAASARKRAQGLSGWIQAPELQSTFDWRAQSRPSRGWALRHSLADDEFDNAMGYLDASLDVHCVDLAEKELQRRWRWRGRLVTLALAFALAALVPQGAIQFLALKATGGTPSVPIGMARVDSLVWTTDDRRTTTTWREAEQHCEGFVVPRGADGSPERSAWRLPEVYELRTLSSSQKPDGLGRKLKPAFQKGVSANYLWSRTSPTDSPNDPERYAADFVRGVILPLPVDVADAAAALCVTQEGADAAVSLERQARPGLLPGYLGISVPVLVAALNLIVFLTLYYGLAEGGRWLHRKRLFGTILGELRESGGRPRTLTATVRPDAVHGLNTVYASTLRRGVASAIDLAIVLLLLVVTTVVAVATIGDSLTYWLDASMPSRITLIAPDGQVVEGDFGGQAGDVIELTTDDGERRAYRTSQTLLEYHSQTGAQPVKAMLPSGREVEGETFLRQQVVAVEPTGEEWFGTIDESTDSDGTTVLTYTAADWEQTRDAKATDLWWKLDAANDASFINAQLQRWLEANPPPAEGTTKTRKLQVQPAEVVSLAEPPIELYLLALFLVAGLVYEAVQVASKRKATLGMRMVGIIRTDLHGEQLSFLRVSARFGLRLISFFTTALGFVVQPFTQKRQTLHDRLAGTVVLRRPNPGAGPASEPSPRYTAAIRLLVGGAYLTFLLLGGVLFLGDGGVLTGTDPDTGSADWAPTSWYGLGAHLRISQMTVDGKPVMDSASGDAPPIALGLNAQPKVRLSGALQTHMPGCDAGACPVHYIFSYQYFIDAPDSPDAPSTSGGVVARSACPAPPAYALGEAQSTVFDIEPTLPALDRPGRYVLMIDFVKRCDAPLNVEGSWPRAVALATIEVK